MRYEKVTYRPEGGRARTVILRDPEIQGNFAKVLVGREVDADGNALLTGGPDGAAIERIHVISEDLVLKRVEVAMHMIYGTFEPI
jgi:hypothetical protein